MKRYAELNREERIKKVMDQRRSDLILVLENLAEERNISAILRTAEGFGVGKVYIIYDEKKPHLSKNISQGGTKWLRVEYFKSVEECLESLKTEDFKVIGALVNPESEILWEQKFSGKVAIIVGNEANGLSEQAQKLVDQNIYLPMFGLTESLNVSVATGIFLYEVIKQKEA